MNMMQFLTIVALIILSLLSLLQIALACGAPLGRYAWGGQHTVLPLTLRISSVATIIIYLFFAFILMNQSEMLTIIDKNSWPKTAIAIMTGYFFLGIIGNAVSKSESERNIMTPTCLVLALIFLYVTLHS